MLEFLRAQLAALATKRAALKANAETLVDAAKTEARALNADETAKFDAALAEIRSADDEIATVSARVDELTEAERREAAAAKVLADSGASRGAPEYMRQTATHDGTDVRRLLPNEARDRAMKVLESRAAVRHIEESKRSAVQEKVERLMSTHTRDLDGSWVARMVLLTENDAYRSAWQKLVTQPTPVLDADEARALNAVNQFRAMSGSADASGGFGVPVLIDPTIIITDQGSLNPFRRLARVETITTDAWLGVAAAGATWSHDAEGSAVSDDSVTLTQPIVPVEEARGFIPFTIRVGQDYPGFANEMAKLLASGYDELQAQIMATGSGSTPNPRGILTALAANTNVQTVVTTDGAFGGTDIKKVWKALPDKYKSNATWVMSHGVGNEVAVFGNGNNLGFVTVDLTGELETIRKRPVEYSSYFPDFTGTTGLANILVVGDFRNYLIADRAGMNVELVPHLFDVTNNRPTGSRGWFAYARYGANSINDRGFQLLQNQ